MPTYGYRCSNCGHEFEIQQKITDQPLKACPKCYGKLAKILYPGGISFKGSGFYTTDYNGSGKSGEGSSSYGAAKASSGSASKSQPKSVSEQDEPSASDSSSKTKKKTS